MNRKMISKMAMLVVCVLAAASSVQAVSIQLGDSGWAMVVNDSVKEVGEVAYPYVFGVKNDSVVIEIDKTFKSGPDELGFFKPIVVEFEKVSADAVSNIIIKDEYIVNKTGYEWHDFHMILAVDLQNPQAGFNPQYIPDGGQLENVYFENYAGYNGNPVQLNFVNSVGDGVGFGTSGNDVFRPGYLGGYIFIATNPDMAVNDRILLKEIPTIVPEPATIALLAFGVLPAILKKKRAA